MQTSLEKCEAAASRYARFADDPVALARELENARPAGRGNKSASKPGAQPVPFRPFGQQVEFAQHFLRVVLLAQEERSSAFSQTRTEVVGNKYNAKAPSIEVTLPADPLKRETNIHCLFGVSGSGKTEILTRLQSMLCFDDVLNADNCASPISHSCENIHTVEDVYRLLLAGLDQVLRRSDIASAAWGGNTKSDQVPDNVVKVCLGHRLSCLILDEVEYLSELSADRQGKIARFLMRLSTDAGVPVFLVGTAAGWDFIGSHHALSKALVGKPKTFWGCHSQAAEWQAFTRELCTSHFGSRIGEAEQVQASIHHHTQGIPRLAQHLLKAATTSDRMRRIVDAPEAERAATLVKVLDDVAADELYPIQHVLDALRSNDPALIRAYRHYGPLDLDFSDLEAKYRARLERELREAEELRRSEEERELLRSLSDSRAGSEAADDSLTLALDIVLHAISQELGCTEETFEKSTRQAMEVLQKSHPKAKPHDHPQAYLKKVLGLIEGDRKNRAAELEKKKVRQQRTIGAKDLRSVLRAGRDVTKALARAGYRPGAVLEKMGQGAT